MSAAERLAALESRVAELAGVVATLVEASRATFKGESALEVVARANAEQARISERAARRRAVVQGAEPARSAAFMELDPPDRAAALKSLPLDAWPTFAAGLTDEAYRALLASLGAGAASLAYALGPVPDLVEVRGISAGTSVRSRSLSLSPGERVVMSKLEWDRKLGSDEDLRELVEGVAGNPARFPAPPRITATRLEPDEARRVALAEWRPGMPLPPRARP